MCKCLRAWPGSIEQSKSTGHCNSLSPGGQYRNESSFERRSGYGYWDAVNQQNERNCEWHGSSERFGTGILGDKLPPSFRGIAITGNVISDYDPINLDMLSRSRRSRCPSRDLSDCPKQNATASGSKV